VTTSDPLDEELSHRRNAAGENRIPPALAVLFAAVVYALLPKSLLRGPRFAVPIIELALLAALIATNPRRMVRQSRWSRIAATASAGLVIVANLAALGMLIGLFMIEGVVGA
jgi:chromate transport protein ChrA